MKLRLTLIVAVSCCAVSPQALAQSWEVSGLAGLAPSAGLDRRAPEISNLDVAGGMTWSVQAAHVLTSGWGAEISWTHQSSPLEVGTPAGKADLFTVRSQQLLGGVNYHFASPASPTRPFAFAGLGATFYSADNLTSETKLSFGFGGGVTYAVWRTLGIRAQFRYKPVIMADEDAGTFCDGFGFCQGALQQIETSVGASFRF